MANSSRSGKSSKRGKPHPDFPLFKHASGRWCKKVKGKFYYFGKVADDPDGKVALATWREQRTDILAGRKPRPNPGGLKLEDLCNEFLHHKQLLVDNGELTQTTWKRYKHNSQFLLKHLGRKCPVVSLRPDDFQDLRAAMARKWGPVAMANEIQMTRSMFRFAHEAELIDVPIRFGPGFKKPSAKTLRQIKVEAGVKMFTPEQIKQLLAVASPNMKAMILLAINGGLGNTDVGTLRTKAVDLDSSWLDWPRPKTAVPRRIPIWAETVEAIRDALTHRPQPKDAADRKLLFIGRRGESYEGSRKGYRVTQEFKRTCDKAEVEGRTFYDLRRTFQTIAEDSRDLVAVQAIMGHAPAAGDMSSVYRQRVSDERLQDVVDVVHDWLYAEPIGDDDGEGQDHIIPFRTVG
jgi:integrase